MKTNLKENKGITLIALIITIIVLLILAVVTITAVNEGNIFAHANNAATKWNAAATEENTMISNYLTEMEKHDGGTGLAGGETGPIPAEYYFDSKYNILLELESNYFNMYTLNDGDEKYTYMQRMQITERIPTPQSDEITFTYKGKSVTLTSENSEVIKGDKFGTYYLFDNTIYVSPGDEDKQTWTLVPNFDTSLLPE